MDETKHDLDTEQSDKDIKQLVIRILTLNGVMCFESVSTEIEEQIKGEG